MNDLSAWQTQSQRCQLLNGLVSILIINVVYWTHDKGQIYFFTPGTFDKDLLSVYSRPRSLCIIRSGEYGLSQLFFHCIHSPSLMTWPFVVKCNKDQIEKSQLTREGCVLSEFTFCYSIFLAHLCICTVGSYASLCMHPSVCLWLDQNSD